MPDVSHFESLLERHRKKNPQNSNLESKVSKYRATAAVSKLPEVKSKTHSVTSAIAAHTGIMSLDAALGGGLPAGIVEIYGAESVGKTALAYSIIRQAQREALNPVLVASEYIDELRMRELGIDTKDLLVVKGSCGESVLEAASTFFAKESKVMILDSATGLRPRVDPPLKRRTSWATFIGSWLEHIGPDLGLDKCVVLVNQVRARRSVDPRKFFAGGTDSTARKIAGLFDTRMELTRTEVSDSFYNLNVNIVVNTLSRPGTIVTLPFVKGQGIDMWRDLVRVASAIGVLKKDGSWYRYKGDLVEQGEEATATELKRNGIGKQVLKDVEYQIY